MTAIKYTHNGADFLLAYDELKIGEGLLLQSMGYADICPEPVLLAVRETLRRVGSYVHIQAGYRILPDDVDLNHNAEIICGECRFAIGKIIKGQLRNSLRLVLFAVTIGDALEIQARELLTGEDPVRGFVIDSAASMIVERAADLLHVRLQNNVAAQGWRATNRFSPGYCGWSVEQQHILFAQLPDKFCGIQLTETALMEPIKSISGIVGLGPDVVRHPYPCDFCQQKDCYKRR